MQERQFEAICTRILNAKKHIANTKQSLIQLKREKPRAVSHLTEQMFFFCGMA